VKKLLRKPAHNSRQELGAFTLLELLVVLATCALIFAMVFPALANTRSGSKAFGCLNNTRRLAIAWMNYTADNAELVPDPTLWIYSSTPSGSFMDWTAAPSNTNVAPLLDPSRSLLARYIQSVDILKCPSDTYLSPVQCGANMGPRTRSYGFSLILGGTPTLGSQAIPNRLYISARKMSDLNTPGPSRTFVVLDEQADSINDGSLALDPGLPQGAERWRDLPASYHNGAANVAFADGHFEPHKWRTLSRWPVIYATDPFPWSTLNLGINLDYEWLDDRMPYRPR
jgi:prepilin-type processing-associated H-X9-DG protein